MSQRSRNHCQPSGITDSRQHLFFEGDTEAQREGTCLRLLETRDPAPKGPLSLDAVGVST